MRLVCLWIGLMVGALLPAQDIDVAVLPGRTHHPTSSEGSRCLNCHMPRIMNRVLFTARTHQIDDKPQAAGTLRFGQQDSPSACLLCHREKDAQWVAQRLQSW